MGEEWGLEMGVSDSRWVLGDILPLKAVSELVCA